MFMAINKRPEDFTPEDIDRLIKENRQLRFENSLLKGRTHARDWDGAAFKPNLKDNPLSLIIKKGENISEYSSFFLHLSVNLAFTGAINENDTSTFQQTFNGMGSPAKCEWLIQKNLCVYLIDLLIDKKIVSKTNRDKYTTQYFGIKDPSKTRNTYWYNKAQKPRNYQAIDKIVEGTFEITDTTPIKIESPETPLY